MSSPLQRYENDLKREDFVEDAIQRKAVNALQRVYVDLTKAAPKKRFFGFGNYDKPTIKGLYLWGGVGRGKTYLMDSFFDSLDFPEKSRTHFHRFMLDIHQRKKRFLEEQDPIALIAEDIAKTTRVLCFDEFYVSDIADAMILGRITEVLFRNGVTLVATSNVEPTLLYKNGLQRDRFLPAIERLQENCEILHLDSPNDFRLRQLKQARTYLHPANAVAHAELQSIFSKLSGDSENPKTVSVNSRKLIAEKHSEGIVWFNFSELCESARSAADYIELARIYHTLIVSNVPALTIEHNDASRRFINLVDECYDRGVKLMISAAMPITSLYEGDRLKFEFQRTQSRLIEMQSEDYLSSPHLA